MIIGRRMSNRTATGAMIEGGDTQQDINVIKADTSAVIDGQAEEKGCARLREK